MKVPSEVTQLKVDVGSNTTTICSVLFGLEEVTGLLGNVFFTSVHVDWTSTVDESTFTSRHVVFAPANPDFEDLDVSLGACHCDCPCRFSLR